MNETPQRGIILLILLRACFSRALGEILPESENVVPVNADEKEPPPPIIPDMRSSSEIQDVGPAIEPAGQQPPFLQEKKLGEELGSNLEQTNRDQIRSSSSLSPAVDDSRAKERVSDIGDAIQIDRPVDAEGNPLPEQSWPQSVNDLAEMAKQSENNADVEPNIQVLSATDGVEGDENKDKQLQGEMPSTTEQSENEPNVDNKQKKLQLPEQTTNPSTGTNEMSRFQKANEVIGELSQNSSKTPTEETTSSKPDTSSTTQHHSELEIEVDEMTTPTPENHPIDSDADSHHVDDDKDLSQDPFHDTGDAGEHHEVDEYQVNRVIPLEPTTVPSFASTKTTKSQSPHPHYLTTIDEMITSTIVASISDPNQKTSNYTISTTTVWTENSTSPVISPPQTQTFDNFSISYISGSGMDDKVSKKEAVSNENENNNDVIHKNELWPEKPVILPTIQLSSSMTPSPSDVPQTTSARTSSIEIDEMQSLLNLAAVKGKKLIISRIIDRLQIPTTISGTLDTKTISVEEPIGTAQSPQSKITSTYSFQITPELPGSDEPSNTFPQTPIPLLNYPFPSIQNNIERPGTEDKLPRVSEVAINTASPVVSSNWSIQPTRVIDVTDTSEMQSSSEVTTKESENLWPQIIMDTESPTSVSPQKNSPTTKPTCVNEENGQQQSRTEDSVTTPAPVAPPAAFVVVVLSVPWLIVCLHEAELRSTLAVQLTGLGTSLVQPSQVVLLGSIDRWPNHLGLLGGANGLCPELRTSRGTPIVLMAYVESNGQADVGLTTTLGKALIRHEIKLPGNEFQNVILEVHLYPKDDTLQQRSANAKDNYMGVVAAFTISGIAGTSLLLLCILLLVLRHRHQKQQQNRRCRPAVLDTYSLDSISIYSSIRRKKNSITKHSYLNLSFTDPTVPSHQINFAGLANACTDQDSALEEEFKSIPMKHSKLKDLPPGVEDKNRYANIIPIPETRVHLLPKKEEPKSHTYINANYVRGHKDKSNAYIACQTPLDTTVADFWRMVWEQQSRVIIMLTQAEEEEMLKCAPYFPDSDFESHKLFGDYQITLKNKEVLHTYTIYTLQIRDLEKNLVRTVTQFWYTAWPSTSNGVPENYCSVLAMLLEARPLATGRNCGPMIVHCSSGTGRTGTIIAIDICMQQFEECRVVDIPRSVYMLRQQRGGSVQTVAQYKFIYMVLNEYASRLANSSLRSSIRSDISSFKKP